MRLLLVLGCILFFSKTATAQVLSGTVRDENGEPLPYATIYQRNTTNGTGSNADGQYRLVLEEGTSEVVFQYIGYAARIEQVVMPANGNKTLHVQLNPSETSLAEVVIDANREDPAYAIMREAIARRETHRLEVGDYTCEAYVKGFQKLLDAPKKIMGQEVGNMGGILDTSNQGVIYLSESVSQLYQQKTPRRSKEVMISSRVSGSPNGFSLNRANLVELNFYEEKIEIERELLSPLADNAFSYYKFKLLSLGYDEGGRAVAQIQVIPKRSNDPVFAGIIFVETAEYHLQSVQLFTTGDNIHQPILDTLRIDQQFVPLQGAVSMRWTLMAQKMDFRFGVLGFKIQGFFSSFFSKYNFLPDFSGAGFGKEAFKVESKSNERDSSYWEAIRPIPLSLEEKIDYERKDSLRLIWESPAFKDSMDREANKFGPMDLLMGYTYRNSAKNFRIGFDSPINTYLFNTVQGYNLRLDMRIQKDSDEAGTRATWFRPSVSYGFSDKRLRAQATLGRRFNKTNQDQFEWSGGTALLQFDPSRPILPAINALYSLYGKQNYLKLYEKTFVRAAYSGRYRSGLEVMAAAEWADRQSVNNTSSLTWYRGKDENKTYTSNNPYFPDSEAAAFTAHQALFLELNLRYRFGQQYMTYPKERIYYDEGAPEAYLRYRRGIGLGKTAFKESTNFDFVAIGFEQDYLSLGLVGFWEWNLMVGAFPSWKAISAPDFHHFTGNQTFIGRSNNYTHGFFRLPYYEFSTREPFVEAHLQHHFKGFLLDKIPGIRKLNLNEVLGFNVLYHRDKIPQTFADSVVLPYWELNFGIENLGFGAFRLFRVDVISSFRGGTYSGTGLMLGVAL